MTWQLSLAGLLVAMTGIVGVPQASLVIVIALAAGAIAPLVWWLWQARLRRAIAQDAA